MCWDIPPLSQYAFMAWCSVKAQGQIYLLPYGLDDRGFAFRQGLGIFPFATASKPALGPNFPPIEWVPWALSVRIKWQEHKTTTHLCLVPRFKMNGTTLSSPSIRLNFGLEQLTIKPLCKVSCVGWNIDKPWKLQ